MKEASGELSMTAITVVAIAAIGGVFTLLVYPTLKRNIINQTKCMNKFNCKCDQTKCTCSYYGDDGKVHNDLECPPNDNDTSSSGKTNTGTNS